MLIRPAEKKVLQHTGSPKTATPRCLPTPYVYKLLPCTHILPLFPSFPSCPPPSSPLSSPLLFALVR